MILIWGFRGSIKQLATIRHTCQRCGNDGAHHIRHFRRKFTLFWIPLFTVKNRYILTCVNCGIDLEITKEAVEQVMASMATPPPPPATVPNPAVPASPEVTAYAPATYPAPPPDAPLG